MAFFVTPILAFASNVFSCYHLADSDISYSYLHDTCDARSRELNALGEAVVAGADEYAKSHILHPLRQAKKDAFIAREEYVIILEGIGFVFDHEKRTKIE